MGIDAYLQSEAGENVQVCGDPKWVLASTLRDADLSRTICLRFIDPFGETLFNPAQASVLLNELTTLRGSLRLLAARKHIDRLIRIARIASRRHLYVRFSGD